MNKLAEAVQFYYGRQYDRAVAYLQSLAANAFWTAAEFPDMPFHTQRPQPQGMGAPR